MSSSLHLRSKEPCQQYKGTNVYNKLKRDNLTEKELHEIAGILNCDYDGIFTFRDTGKQV